MPPGDRDGEQESNGYSADAGQNNRWIATVLDRAFGALERAGLTGIKESPGALKAVVAIAFLAVVSGMAFAAVLAIKGATGFALIAFLAVLAVVAISLVVCYKYVAVRSASVSTRVHPLHSGNPTWTRLVPKLPMSEDTLAEFQRGLETVRGRACAFIQVELGVGQVQLAQVRANVFLPDTDELGSGGFCSLHMPKGLQVGMTSSKELAIRFWPGQGLTGVVFKTQTPQAATFTDATDAADGDRHDEFELTREQKNRVHPELKWIVSCPLKVQDGDKTRTMGVLNVDGLEWELTDEQIQRLMSVVVVEVCTLTGLLMKLPKRRVAVFVEDENG